jgi:hypothetical protein
MPALCGPAALDPEPQEEVVALAWSSGGALVSAHADGARPPARPRQMGGGGGASAGEAGLRCALSAHKPSSLACPEARLPLHVGLRAPLPPPLLQAASRAGTGERPPLEATLRWTELCVPRSAGLGGVRPPRARPASRSALRLPTLSVHALHAFGDWQSPPFWISCAVLCICVVDPGRVAFCASLFPSIATAPRAHHRRVRPFLPPATNAQRMRRGGEQRDCVCWQVTVRMSWGVVGLIVHGWPCRLGAHAAKACDKGDVKAHMAHHSRRPVGCDRARRAPSAPGTPREGARRPEQRLPVQQHAREVLLLMSSLSVFCRPF